MKKDLFQTYLKKINVQPLLNGVVTDGVETLASDGRTVLWYRDSLYTSLAPQITGYHQDSIRHGVAMAVKGETLASVTISGEYLKLMSDMLSHNKPTYVTLHIRKMGKSTVLVAGTKDTGMVVMPTKVRPFGPDPITKDDAPFLFWGMDEVEDASDVSL